MAEIQAKPSDWRKERISEPFFEDSIAKISNINDKCPHCDALVQSNVINSEFHYFNKDNIEVYFLVRCGSEDCRKIFLKTAQFSRIFINVGVNGRRPTDQIEFHRWNEKFPISFDTEVSASDHEHIPDNVREDYVEALKCEAIECYKAACVMFRRSLESAARLLIEEEIESEEEKKKHLSKDTSLYEKINALQLDKNLKDFAHEIRLTGNLGAHADDDGELEKITAEDVKLANQFLTQLFQHKFILPKKLKKARGKEDESEAPDA